MSKKILVVLISALSCLALSCGHDHATHCSWADVNYCDGDYVVSCDPSSRQWKDTYCDYGCIEAYNGAYCKSNGDRPGPGPVDTGCGRVTDKGTCDGNVAKVCVDDAIVSRDCGSLTCGLRQDGHVDCLKGSNVEKPPVSESNYVNGADCGDVTYEGLCDGDKKLVYCDNNKKLNVSSCDTKCIMDGTYAQCYEACGSLDNDGVCDDDLRGFKYCDANLGVLTRVCNDGYSCKKGDKGYVDCY